MRIARGCLSVEEGVSGLVIDVATSHSHTYYVFRKFTSPAVYHNGISLIKLTSKPLTDCHEQQIHTKEVYEDQNIK